MNPIKQLFLRRKLWSDLSDEIEGHLRERTDELVDQGMSREEAERIARREFGNTLLIEERGREVWTWPSFESVLADVRFGVRQLRKTPSFTIVALLTLTIGIGANTAIFSVVNGVLLNPLPFPQPNQLVTLHESKPNFSAGSISFPNFLDWQKSNSTFSLMAITRPSGATLTGAGDAEMILIEYVSSDVFRVLGIKPVIGRDLASGEDRIGGEPLALISEAFWKEKFQASPAVLGKDLTLDGRVFTIVGVMPSRLETINNFTESPVYLPIGQWRNNLLGNRSAGLGIHGIGRLKPGVTIQQARADMEHVNAGLEAAYPGTNKGIGTAMFPMKQQMVGRVSTLLWVLLTAVGFVLVIACVNVANLTLAQSTARSREFAIRTSLGAGRKRLIRQLLTESLLLSVTGGILGTLLAALGTQAALKSLPEALPRANGVSIDSHVLIFAIAVSLVAGGLFGLVPALKASGSSLQSTLKEGGRGSGGARRRTQNVLVAIEIGMAVVLLIGAGLMIRTMERLARVDPGFSPHNVMLFGVSLPPSMNAASPEAVQESLRQVGQAVQAIPGVEAVSMSNGAIPLGDDDEVLFWPDGQPKPVTEDGMSWAVSYVVEPDYLRVMGIRLKRGRFFNKHDDRKAPLVIVVDDTFASKYFPGEDPVGKRVNLSNGDLVEVVGVVEHVKQWSLDSDGPALQAELYRAVDQLKPEDAAATGGRFMLRSNGPRPGLFDAIRDACKRIDSQEVLFGQTTMDAMSAELLAGRRFSMILLQFFAGLALLLASIGVYGVVSYSVGQRTHEIGVRMAMGAKRLDILRLVLGQGSLLAMFGIAAGLFAARGLTHFMSKLLFEVGANDPVTFTGVAVVLAAVALAASYIPARRAMRVNPTLALRYE